MHISGPRLIVLHTALDGRAANEQILVSPQQIGVNLTKYFTMMGGHAVAIYGRSTSGPSGTCQYTR